MRSGVLRRIAPAVGLAVTTLLPALVAAATPPVRVVSGEGFVEVDNGLVKVRVARDDAGLRQEYLAARGDAWVPLAAGWRPRGGPQPIAPLYDTAIDPAHRILVTECLGRIDRVAGDDEAAVTVLAGATDAARIEQSITVRRGEQLAHVEVRATLAGEAPRLEYLLLPFVMAWQGPPDVSHAPAYEPTNEAVIGDRSFFSPAACLQQNGLFVGLMPDLDIVEGHVVRGPGSRRHPDSNSFPVPVDETQVSMPTALDVEVRPERGVAPVLSYGMMDYVVHQHVWFHHPSAGRTMVRTLSQGDVRIGMDLLLAADAPQHRGYQLAARHLWRRYGRPNFAKPRPQAMPFAAYAEACYPAHFAYQGYDVAGTRLAHRQLPDRPDRRVWQAWELDGQAVGGLRLHAPQWENFVVNLAWWNNACDATGLFAWSRRLDRGGPLAAELGEKAERMIALALAAPQDRGLFPAIYDLRGQRWLRGLWNPPLEGYDPTAARAFWDWDSGQAAYQTAAASVTAGYLMTYRRTCRDDPRIVDYVRRYGDFLIAAMLPDGRVPGWFTADLRPLPSLAWNADGGAHAWVLAELHLATGEPRYLEAARRAAAFLETEVLPRQRWADFEAFYSCAIKPETFHDARTGQGPCNTMSISWALQGFLALHEATGARHYLDAAEATADFASLFQAVWAPHFVITAHPFGGITSQLGDADWLDQRAHRFAEPLVRIGLLTGRQDLVERGVAAARSSLTLVNHPRHRANGIYVHTDFPEGLGPENVDHEGFPQRPLSSGPSWGAVGGLAGAAHVLAQLGGAYVDLARDITVGVDGVGVRAARREGRVVRIDLVDQLAALAMPYDAPRTIELRVVGLPDAGDFELVLDGGPPAPFSAAALAALELRVEGGGFSAPAVPAPR
ncbi:MAG: hypothetical protein FJ284_01675 [Planctomycetes bacterium]|nr:hypothetical protein [Planctomycetota bacterium]